MCGIFGYIGTRETAGNLILDGLKLLEYRGYDSWGVAVKQTSGSIFIEKHPGKIGEAKLPPLSSHMGIGHTRWATHGGVTAENAHPHVSQNKNIAVVHNGIVENFEELKSDLVKKGYHFCSETDSEVIPHLLEEYVKTLTPLNAMQKLMQQLKGMNAVLAFFVDSEECYIVKNGSPLVVGKAKEEVFVASDVSAILPHTQQVHFVTDGELIRLSTEGAHILKEKKLTELTFQHVAYDPAHDSQGNYPHIMLKEIEEQPLVLERFLTSHDDVETAAQAIHNAYGTYLIGCGTASYACLAGTYLFSKIAKRHVNFSISSEFSYLLDFLKHDSLVVALSQSGETIDTISSVSQAKQKGAKLLSVTNGVGSTLSRMADYSLFLSAGPERAVASTKAYTAKIALLYRIAHELAHSRDVGIRQLKDAIRAVVDIIRNKIKIRDLAKTISSHDHIFILGRGISYAAALESALKIKEVSYIHAEGFAAGELKHGVIALITQNTPVILYNPQDETYHDTLSAAHEVKARGAFVIGVSSVNNPVYDHWITVPHCDDASIIPQVVIAQLLGYYLALEKGFDPDKPRNLAKSVTVK